MPSNTPSMLGFAFSSLIEPTALLVREVSAIELMPRFQRVAAEKKHDGTVVTVADLAVEAALATALPQIANYPVLGEEMDPTEQQHIWQHAEWFWCVDPLDGTVNYAAGRKYFGISVALMHRRRSVFGLVYDPNLEELFFATQNGGATVVEKSGAAHKLKPQPAVSLGEARLEIGRVKRLGRLQSALRAKSPCRKVGQSGASVLQWCHLATGRIDIFLHAGERPWDYAAGALILEEAGGRVATLDHDDYWRTHDADAMWEQSVVAARHPRLFDEWKSWVRMHY
ncbi:MAG: inositol monophosphatase family protein [Rhodocyclaceae bacterium]|nr:inositol monophosphatase family protein [Rhodocyclaceae bacterium]